MKREETKNMTNREKDIFYSDYHTWRIVESDNFGGDYPDEKFVNLPLMDKATCNKICQIVNDHEGENSSRYYKTVNEEYVLQPGFEP